MRTLATAAARVHSVDVVRGAVLVLMVLDHVRHFFSDALVSPTDLSHASPALFLTRWITHFCAPVFVMLAGTSAFLSAHSRVLTRTELARYLVTRGAWLVVLELTVVRFGWLFNLDYEVAFGQVIWALGWSMIVLAGLVFLRTRTVLLFGGVLILGHNLLDGIDPAAFGAFADAWRVLHAPGRIELAPGHVFFTPYSLVPWVGVMALGYGIAPLFTLELRVRQRWLLLLGSALTIGFVLVRAVNGYGDPKPWVAHDSGLLTVLSFLNCTKYPPSLDYLLMTLGPALVALALLDRPAGRLGGVLETFGRVPLFFYLIHLPLVHGLAVALAAARHEDVAWLFRATGTSPIPSPPSVNDGVSLPVVYAIWLGAVILLYPLCRWYAEVKRRRSDLQWLRYL
ncbi:MAG: heparan-alpha-glucosaminide N-acetyltransferase domain-containing protein [Burkholderiales bacterium]